LFPTSL